MAKSGLLSEGIAMERSSLECVRSQATLIIDTSNMLPATLRKRIVELYTRYSDTSGMSINIISFGFKYGVPREADLVFDLRFLANPYFVDELRPMSGKDKPVADYVFNSPHAREYRDKLVDLLFFMLPLMEAEGRYRITVAVGCTGGRHRSVAMAEEILQALRQADYPAFLEHRHLELG